MSNKALIHSKDEQIATLQEAVMLLKKRNYAKEDEITLLQATIEGLRAEVAFFKDAEPYRTLEAEIAALQARVRELESGMSFAEYKERYTPTTEK